MFVNVTVFSESHLRISSRKTARHILGCLLVSRIPKQNNDLAVQMQKYTWLSSSELCMMTNHVILVHRKTVSYFDILHLREDSIWIINTDGLFC